MDRKIDPEELDKKMRDKGWSFIGPIMEYEKAWKNQASVYEKNGEYVVSGIDSTGENELFEHIDEKEAKKRVKESFDKIKKHMFSN